MHPGHGARAADPKVVGSEDALPPVQEPWLITGGGGGGGGGRGVNPQLVVHGGDRKNKKLQSCSSRARR